MTKARNLSDLLDATGDVVSSALDNVPPSDNASSLTTGTLDVARLSDGSITNAKLNNDAKVVKSATAPSTPSEGDLWYDTTNEALKIYNITDNAFIKIVTVIPTLDSISGDIFNTVETDLTLTGTGFLLGNLIVSFTPSGGSASTVSVTPTNDTTATVTVPSVIYNQSASTVIGIKVTNSDNKNSTTINKTVIALPSGGTITNSGGYRYHLFTSSGTFTNTTNLSVDYLAVAGGGGGGRSGFGAGGGAGGLLQSTASLTAQNYSIVIGAGGSAYSNGANTTGLGITAVGGGKGGTYIEDGYDGGSGGGGGGDQFRAGGSGTAGQGNDGGLGQDVGSESAGGGGGAGAVGGNGTTGVAGAGGIGLQYSAWATATSTGDSGYYAGGGGGGIGRNDNANANFSVGASGGTGGGGTGGLSNYANSSFPNASPTAGLANTGGGGGGGSATSSSDPTTSGGASGGSGIFIIRYQL